MSRSGDGLQAADVGLIRPAWFDGDDVCIEVLSLAFRLKVILQRHLVAHLLNDDATRIVALYDLDQLCNNFERIRSSSPRIEYDGISTFSSAAGNNGVTVGGYLLPIANVDGS